jgi:cytochrome bd ubiquinol oxidase subunit II
MDNHKFTGTIWSWFNLYSALFTLGVLSGYVMLGANYLILKTDGEIQQRSIVYSYISSVATFLVSLMIYICTIIRHPYITRKWLVLPDLIHVAFFPGLAVLAFGIYLWQLYRRSESGPLIWNAVFVVCSFTGISVGFYPYIVPNMMTIHDAAVSSPRTLIFMLAVIIILLPLILTYIGFKNWIFRGKVGSAGYGD